MIELKDPYWRKLLAFSVGAAAALSLIALAAFPMLESGGGGGSPYGGAAGGGLVVGALQSSAGPTDNTSWLVVNVTDPGPATATSIQATLSGADLVPQPDTGGGFTGRLGRGGMADHTVDVLRASRLQLSLRATSFTVAGSLSLALKSPTGKTWSSTGGGTTQSLALEQADLEAGGDGAYTATVAQTGGLRAISYNLSYSESYPAPSATQSWDNLSKGESHAFAWLVASGGNASLSNATVKVDATLATPGGGSAPAHYLVGSKGAAAASAAGGGPFLTSGEFLGFSAIGIIGVAVTAGALRTRGGRARSQDRARFEVTWHRLAWITVLAVAAVHGTVQLASGHLGDVGAIAVGVAAFGLLVGLVWFNAFNRPRVLSMEWPKWLRLKVAWVGAVLLLVALHLLLFGRHFAG